MKKNVIAIEDAHSWRHHNLIVIRTLYFICKRGLVINIADILFTQSLLHLSTLYLRFQQNEPIASSLTIFLVQSTTSLHFGCNIEMSYLFVKLLDCMSIYCKFDNTSPINIPKPMICTPPNTGYGIVINMAANLPTIAHSISITPNIWYTYTLATWR